MSFGFQRDDARVDTDGFGVQPFGTSAFGGGGYPVYEPPVLQPGSDDPTTDLVSSLGEVVLEREGVTLAARTFMESRKWHLVFKPVALSDVTSLRTFWRVRRFRLLPDVTDEATYWIVRWRDREFRPLRLRGGQPLFDLSFDLEEVP